MKHSPGRKQRRRIIIKGMNKPSSKHYRKPHVFTCQSIINYNLMRKKEDNKDDQER